MSVRKFIRRPGSSPKRSSKDPRSSRVEDLLKQKIENDEWVHLVNVPVDVLSQEGMVRGLAFRFDTALDLAHVLRSQLSASEIYASGDVYFSGSCLQKINKTIAKHPLPVMRHLVAQTQRAYKRLVRTARHIARTEPKACTDAALLSLFETFSDVYQSTMATLVTPVFLERFTVPWLKNHLRRTLSDNALISKRVADVCLLSQPSSALRFHLALLRLACLVADRVPVPADTDTLSAITDQDRILKLAVSTLVKQYEFMGMRYLSGKPTSKSDIIARVVQMLPFPPSVWLADEERKREKDRAQLRRLIAQFQVQGEGRTILGYARLAVRLRAWRLDMTNQACLAVRPLLQEIGARISLSFDDLIYLTSKELSQSLQHRRRPTTTLPAARRAGYVCAAIGHEVVVLTGRIADSTEKALSKSYLGHLDELHGLPASPGKATGQARVVSTSRDLDDFPPGCILVAKMTTPDYLPAIAASAAIVTDIGGVTSHAATLSRMLNKPCVVGTELATSHIRNGDIIEVDGTLGIVVLPGGLVPPRSH